MKGRRPADPLHEDEARPVRGFVSAVFAFLTALFVFAGVSLCALFLVAWWAMSSWGSNK